MLGGEVGCWGGRLGVGGEGWGLWGEVVGGRLGEVAGGEVVGGRCGGSLWGGGEVGPGLPPKVVEKERNQDVSHNWAPPPHPEKVVLLVSYRHQVPSKKTSPPPTTCLGTMSLLWTL